MTTNNKAITTARLFQWMKNVKPLVKCNAVESCTTFDIYLLNELDVLIELLTKELSDDDE